MTSTPFDDQAPSGPDVTDYDERHCTTYWRLLDAASENADWREVVSTVFEIDLAAYPERARAMYDTHLARARWMSETGYRHYLGPRVP